MWDNEDAIKRWDQYAEEMGKSYTDDGDLNRRFLLNPVIFKLIGKISGKFILDAGCGEGYLSRLLSRQGAQKVVGVDYSKKMVEVAKRKTPKGSIIEYKHGSCEELNFLSDNCFDVVVSNMVIHDLANHENAFKEIYRVLVNNGTFVFSILHPCFDTPNSGWLRNDEGEKLYWKVKNYFSEGPNEQRSNSDQKLLWFHRTLSSYFNSLRKVGFSVEAIEEPKPNEEAMAYHQDYKYFLDICHFLVFKAVKTSP
ncbi:class I SAM-dependent methyltransferase [Paenibacillus lactis]|uniref:class I SAM-dependent methyltransferase n=1 Tax=Paenibacillus lactis TaxID=228574 RepID=UPI0011A6DCF1